MNPTAGLKALRHRVQCVLGAAAIGPLRGADRFDLIANVARSHAFSQMEAPISRDVLNDRVAHRLLEQTDSRLAGGAA